MLRTFVAVALVATLAAAAVVTASEAALAPEPQVKSIGQRIHEHHAHAFGPDHPTAAPAPLAGDPVDRARDALTVETYRGRTAKAWVANAEAARLSGLAPEAGLPEADLAEEVLRIHRLFGITDAARVRAQVEADAAALPVELRAPFAGLVATVADAYEAQKPLAAEVMARFPGPLDEGGDAALLGPDELDAMAARAEGVVAAVNAFRAAVAGVDVQDAGAPLFEDPYGLVILGGPGDDTYESRSTRVPLRGDMDIDPAVHVDLGGDDTYRTSAGGACPDPFDFAHDCNELVVSVLADLSGSDTYVHDSAPAAVQGAGSLGGIGLLLEFGGHDVYASEMIRTTRGPFFSYVDGGAQGFGQGGYGLLLDVAGRDLYRADVASGGRSIWNFAQGFGSLGGLGILADADGDDAYLANGLGIPCSGRPGTTGCGFQGVYNNGVGFYGGVGLLSDTGMGNDRYHAWNNGTTVDYYAQGFGAFGGLGILYEDGGSDDYVAVEIATDPWIDPLLNCAFGTGSLGGVGIMIEMGGDDRYHGESRTPYTASVMNEGFGGIGAAYGLLVDVSGDDGHFMYANGDSRSFTAGRGVLVMGGNIAGNYLDLGGEDEYVGADRGLLLGGSRDAGAWFGGADFNAPEPLAMLGWSP